MKKEIFEILYIDKVTNKIVTTLGTNLKVGTVEMEWYDLNKKLRMWIHKNNFISRIEVKNGR